MRRMHADALPHVPFGDPVFGHVRALRARRLELFEAALAQGPLSQMALMGRRFVVAASPQAASELLVDHAKVSRKSPGLRMLLGHLAGDGLFMSEGELWRRQRRLMAPLFQPAIIGRYAQVMTDTAADVAGRWSDGQRVDLAHEMTRVTMEIVARTLFGADAADQTSELGQAITALLDWVNNNASNPMLVAHVAALELSERVLPGLPLPEGWRAGVRRALSVPSLLPGTFSSSIRNARAVVETRLDALIAERRARPVDRDDLLSRLLKAQDEDGASMSDQQVRDEAATLFVAGHETTANALSWSLHLLAQNPDVHARLLAEVDALGGRTPGFEDVMRVPLAIRVFKEALRLYPPLTILVRQVLEEVTLEGVTVPAGRIVFVPVWALHRSASVWKDPLRFDPDRFLPEREQGRHRAAWLPFGIGPRVCIGNHFALLEGPLVLVRLLQLVEFHAEPRDVEPDDFATLRPRGGVWARAVHRARAP